jgi:NADH-quinone oxidoreductase subunit A
VLGDYLPILMLLGLSTLFAVGSIFVASKVGPSAPSPAKLSPYESGIVPERLPREKFPVKFYIVAMIFIVFDIEVIFFYPFAVIFRELGLFGLAEMGVFIALVLVAYFYILRAGGLDWEEEASARYRVSARLLREARLREAERLGA